MSKRVVIIGAGPAGISAYLWAIKMDLAPLIIEQNKIGGNLNFILHKVRGYPGVDQTGLEFSKSLEEQIGKHTPIIDQIYNIDPSINTIQGNKDSYQYDYLILASGLRLNQLDIDQGDGKIKYSAPRSFDYFMNHNSIVVGSGDGAVEHALLMSKVCPHVYLISRSSKFKARKQYLSPAENAENIEFIYNDEIERIEDEKSVLKSGRIIDSTKILAKIGFVPNTDILPDQIEQTDSKLIKINSHHQTTVPNIYAVGDICSRDYPSIAYAAGTASIAIKHIDYKINSIS